MEQEEMQRQQRIASLNITINKFTDHEAVEHEFLLERWHEVESVLWNTRLQLKDGDDVESLARATATSAAQNGMLHHTLVEHAILWTLMHLK